MLNEHAIPRVVHFAPFQSAEASSLSGANRSMLVLAGSIAERGGEASMVLLEDGVVADLARARGVHVEAAFRAHEYPRGRVRRALGNGCALQRVVRSRDIELIHCHSAIGNRHCWPVAKLCRVPLITHQRDTYRDDRFHKGLGLADHIIAISNWVRESLPERYRKHLDVIYNAIEVPDGFSEPRPRCGPLKIATAGRCHPDKGQDLLVEAALALAPEFEFEVHIWGMHEKGRDKLWADKLRALAARGGPESESRFHFQPFRADINALYESADIVVVGSRNFEGFGRVAAEAMAYACPTVVAGHSGLLEIVDHGETGLLFKNGDSASLEQQLRVLLEDEALRMNIGRAGREKVERCFSIRAHTDAVLGVYGRVLGR